MFVIQINRLHHRAHGPGQMRLYRALTALQYFRRFSDAESLPGAQQKNLLLTRGKAVDRCLQTVNRERFLQFFNWTVERLTPITHLLVFFRPEPAEQP